MCNLLVDSVDFGCRFACFYGVFLDLFGDSSIALRVCLRFGALRVVFGTWLAGYGLKFMVVREFVAYLRCLRGTW